MSRPTDEEVERWFSYHPPKDDQSERYQRLRDGAKVYAKLIMECCPESADRTSALRQLREANWAANASIACNE